MLDILKTKWKVREPIHPVKRKLLFDMIEWFKIPFNKGLLGTCSEWRYIGLYIDRRGTTTILGLGSDRFAANEIWPSGDNKEFFIDEVLEAFHKLHREMKDA